jgi:F-type H+-transporting ATPase subunit b
MNALLILASEEPNGSFIPGDVNEFYWGLLAFLIVVGLIAWKGGPAISKFMKGHSEKIETELAEAEGVRDVAEAKVADLESALGDAGSESSRILADARATATQLEADLRNKADADVVEMRVRAEVEIESLKAHAAADLQARAAALTLGAAEAVVRQNLDAEAQGRLVEDYISEVGAQA